MKCATFEHHGPATLKEAVDLLADLGAESDVKLLAGGQSLVPVMALRLAQPEHVIDLNPLEDEIGRIEVADGHLRLGAMVRQRTAERSATVAAGCPLLSQALPLWAHPQIRTRGTLGGSLAHADPAAEWPAIALALNASVVVHGLSGERTIPAAEFFIGFLTTSLEPDEVVTRIDVPLPAPGTGSSFQEVSRRHGDFAMVGAAATVTLDRDVVTGIGVALSGVGSTPVRAQACESLLAGRVPTDDAVREAAAATAATLTPLDDLHATADYRRLLAETLMKRTLTDAISSARR
jgi:aerobic carbon-monoxide dehydrogenase medium subunit